MNISSILTDDCKSLLTFDIGGIEYCLSNTMFSIILKPDNIFQLGNAEKSRYSLFQIDNKSVPLIDLKKILIGNKQKIDEHSRIITVEYKNIQFGLLVEKINEIIAVDEKFVTTSLQFIPELKHRYIQGTIEFEDRKLILLNIERIVTDIGCI